MRGFRLFYAAMLLISLLVIIDQALKWLVVREMAYGEQIPFLPFLSWLHARNTGVAFSLFADSGPLFVLALPTLICGVLIYMLFRTNPAEWLTRLGLVMILGGAIGNLIDRVRLGYVVDYIFFHTPYWSFAIFNFADMAITIGAGLIILQEIILWRRSRKSS